MKRSVITAAAIATLGWTAAQADTLGGEIAIGGWNHDPSGWILYPNDDPTATRVDADDDLHLDTQSDLYLRAKFEHPLPFIPNLKLAYVHTATEGDGTVTKGFTFGDITVGINENIHSETELDNYDATIYYEIIDGDEFNLDLGLTVRYMDGYVYVKSKTTGLDDTADIDFVVPMLYGNVRAPIPFLEGLSAGAEGNWIGYDGSTLFDFQADLRYTFAMGLGVEAGYRWQKIKLDDVDDTDADIDIDGFFVGLVWDF
jgi:outer membrane protein